MAVGIIDGLLLNIDPNINIVTGLGHETISHRDKEDREFLTSPHQRSLLRYTFSKEIFCEGDLTALVNFHNSVSGSAFGFLWQDPLDNFVANTVETFLNGNAYTQGILVGKADGVNTSFQLYKFYGVQGGANHWRPLTRIDGINVYRNGLLVPDTEYSLNVNTGIVTFNTAGYPAFSQLTADILFYVPVRFTNDRIDYELVGNDGTENIYNLQPTELIEIRETPSRIEVDSYTSANASFVLDNYIGTVVSPNFETQVISLASGYESRSLRLTSSQAIYNSGDRVLCNEEIFYLVCFFRTMHGNSLPFLYDDKTEHGSGNILVRFDSELNYTFLAPDTWNAPGVVFKTHEPIPDATITNDTYGNSDFVFGGTSCPFVLPAPATYYWTTCNNIDFTRFTYSLGHNGVVLEWSGTPDATFSLIDRDRETTLVSGPLPGNQCRYLRGENLTITYFSDLDLVKRIVTSSGLSTIVVEDLSTGAGSGNVRIRVVGVVDETFSGNTLYYGVVPA